MKLEAYGFIMKLPGSLLRRSSRFGCDGRKLWVILRNFQKPPPSFAKATDGSFAFIPVASYRVFSEGESSRWAIDEVLRLLELQ